MNVDIARSPKREMTSQLGDDLSSIGREAPAASPRDQLEFGAKVLGFAGDVGDDVAIAEELAAQGALAVDERPAIPRRAGATAIIHVQRAEPNLVSSPQHAAFPPRASTEWQRVAARRLGVASAAFALVATAICLICLWGVPGTQRDSPPAFVAVVVILPALYGLSLLLLEAVYGKVSGAAAAARKYMDQVYPPGKDRQW